LTFKRKLPKANAADCELAHKAATTPTSQAAIVNPRREDVHIQAFIFGASDGLLLRIAVFLFDSAFSIIKSAFQLSRFVH
jgi:hypothetical protein